MAAVIVDRESTEWQTHGAPDGTLPLCESDNKNQLQNVLAHSGHFYFNGRDWIFSQMAANQDIDTFMQTGRELQKQIDEGKFST